MKKENFNKTSEGLAQIVENSIVIDGKKVYTSPNLNKNRKWVQNDKYVVWAEEYYEDCYEPSVKVHDRWRVVTIKGLEKKEWKNS